MRSFYLVAGLALLGACSSGTDADSINSANVHVVLTDAPSPDLAAFEVDVTGLLFHRLDGAEVSALPRATRVDFVELDQLRELIGPARLTAGRYTGATMTFDFANATALVVGGSAPATILDADGQPITGEVAVEVTFPAGRWPSIVPSRRHVIQFDLDLSQAIEVDSGQNQITFRPTVAVTFDPFDLRPVALRGELVSVDPAARRFVLRRLARDGSPLTEVTVATGLLTVFQVSGDVYGGALGPGALSSLAPGSRVYVQGVLDALLPGVRAVAVEAGAGVPGAGQDQVHGWIVGRTTTAGADAELTVLGRSRDADSGQRRFHTTFTVRAPFGGTKVLLRGLSNPANTDALSVGQRIWAFGDLDGTTMDCGPVARGVVRVLPTSVLGHANDAAAGGALSVDLGRIGWHAIDAFDFAIGGQPELDPATVSFDVADLDVSRVGADSLIAATGWFGPVGVMSDRDFAPYRLVDRTANGFLLLCRFAERVGAGALTIAADHLTVAIDDASVAVVGNGIAPRPLDSAPTPTIRARQDLGLWFLVQRRRVTLHLSFAEFLADLTSQLDAGAVPAAVSALGGDDASTQVLTASVATVVLRDAAPAR